MSDGNSASNRSNPGRSALCFEFSRDGESIRVKVRRDVDPTEEAAITTSEPDGRDFGDSVPEMRLPGSGSRLDDCGDRARLNYCSSCGSTIESGRTCRRSMCPRCWQSWCLYRTISGASKIEGFRRYQVASGVPKPKYHHLVASLPRSFRVDAKNPIDRVIEILKVLLLKINVDTGMIIYHPYRIVEAYRGDVMGHESGTGDMTWADVLSRMESDDWSWEAIRNEFLTFAPHFHIIANSDFAQCGAITKGIEEQTGIVIHRITKGEDSSVSLYDMDDLCSATAYSLSHAGLSWDKDNEEYRAVTRYFGEVANFDPSDGVVDDIDGVARGISADVLGVDFDRGTCSETASDTAGLSNTGTGAGYLPNPSRRVVEMSDPRDLGPSATPSIGDGAGSDGVAADGGWEATRGVSPAFLDDPNEVETPHEDRQKSRCRGEIRPISEAPRQLDNDEWCAEIGRDAESTLREAVQEWKEMGRPLPD